MSEVEKVAAKSSTDVKVVERKRARDIEDEEESWTHDFAENPWRYKAGEATTIEMLLPCGRITQISAHRHQDIRMYPWHSSIHKRLIYVTTSYMEGGRQKNRNLHAVLNGQFAIRDHINRDGLDNRDENIRDGDDGVNGLNKHLKTGGVTRSEKQHSWKAVWTGLSGKPESKTFTWEKGNITSEKLQHEAALEHRQKMASSSLAALLAKRPQGPIECVTMSLPSPKLKGFHFRDINTARAGLVGSIRIDSEKRFGWWQLSHYSNEDLVISGTLHESDFAMNDALDWWLEKKEELCKKRMKEDTNE